MNLVKESTNAVNGLHAHTAKADTSKIIYMGVSTQTQSLCLCTLVLLRFAIIAREPERDKQHESSTCAERAGIVGPCRAQESRVPVVPWGHDRHDSATGKVRPPMSHERDEWLHALHE